MRFVLLNQFYPPDPAPTGQYLHGLARFLVQRGHEVSVLCSRRSYDGSSRFPKRSILGGIDVVRLPAAGFGRRGFLGKMADYASFYLSLLTALFFQRARPDVILSLTTPPYIGLLGKFAAWRYGCRHSHWIMDLYPDVLFAHGMTRYGLVFRFLQALTRFQLRGADSILALGPKMAQRVAAYQRSGDGTPKSEVRRHRSGVRGPSPEFGGSSVRWFPLWSDPELAPWPDSKPNPLRAERGWTEDEVVFLYSGNMGLGHRFGEFLELASRLGPSGPRWVFSGGGKRRAELEAFARLHPATRIEFLDYVPHIQLRAHLCAADVHLASLDSAWQGLMVPSKLQASFAVGRPVLFVGGRDNETALWVEQSGGGWVVDENDLDGLLDALRQALVPEERRRRGVAALQFARAHFQMSSICSRITHLLETGSAILTEGNGGKPEQSGSPCPTIMF